MFRNNLTILILSLVALNLNSKKLCPHVISGDIGEGILAISLRDTKLFRIATLH